MRSMTSTQQSLYIDTLYKIAREMIVELNCGVTAMCLSEDREEEIHVFYNTISKPVLNRSYSSTLMVPCDNPIYTSEKFIDAMMQLETAYQRFEANETIFNHIQDSE